MSEGCWTTFVYLNVLQSKYTCIWINPQVLKEGESLQGEENSKINVKKTDKFKPSNTDQPVSDNGTKNLINKHSKKTKKSNRYQLLSLDYQLLQYLLL
jgi:hypothetical protein